MLIKKASHIPSSEITDERWYLKRRDFFRVAGSAVLGAAAAGFVARAGSDVAASAEPIAGPGSTAGVPITNISKRVLTTNEKLNTFEEITNYNNFYEFGTGKSDPARYAGRMTTRPWTVKVDGLCNKPAEYQIEDLLKSNEIEERVYRFRCVEAWSMVIPWDGIPLASLLKRAEPTSKATFVEFKTLARGSEMPGLSEVDLDWPYTEGLRMDEAMHPLTLLAVGMYGKTLLNQNGAPLRLVVPWKYGFKSIKSIVHIRFVNKMPLTAWVEQNPSWYGFYSNVNPDVSPVRWDQSRERRLPGYFATRKTELFNGYGDQVASMYAGMDLRKNY
jgi:methionine sulfoxide reductase catalytic subunit